MIGTKVKITWSPEKSSAPSGVESIPTRVKSGTQRSESGG
jgi:hypothetical protein